MDHPVAGPVSPVAVAEPVLIAGLFGKLPAHGDFVRRGWSDETVVAIDRWLSDAIGTARATRDDAAFGAWMRAAPLWRGFVPAGKLGPHALHLGVAPSIDRAGRLFPIVAGVAGAAADAWHHAETEGGAIDAAIYDALAGHADADATLAAIAVPHDVAAQAEAPARSAWWRDPDGAPLIESDAVDAALLGRLLDEGQGA